MYHSRFKTGHLDKQWCGNKAYSLFNMLKLGLEVPEFTTYGVDESPFNITETSFPWMKENMLVSIRSGAAVSMPGMMDTILNVGIHEENLTHFSDLNSEKFAYSTYSRFLESYGHLVLEIPSEQFSVKHEIMKDFYGNLPLDAEDYKLLVAVFTKVWKSNGFNVSDLTDVPRTLTNGIAAIKRSWNNERAIEYRKIENIGGCGTAVTVQKMVFGNLNSNSCTGVVFSRNPNSGENELYGDFLTEAQGEDVVSGTHNTQPIANLALNFPKQFEELRDGIGMLEEAYGTPMDIEFTVENGKLYWLQARSAKMAHKAQVRTIVEFAIEGKVTAIDAATSILEMAPENISHNQDCEFGELVGEGIPAVDGTVSGVVYVGDIESVPETPFILVRNFTDPNDCPLIAKAAGVITFNGGLVSHAAVITRAWNIPCIVGAEGKGALKGLITMNGSTGKIYKGV